MRTIAPILAIVLALSSGACAPRRDHTTLLEGIPTKQITLEPRNTRASSLTLRVPTAFDADWTRDAAYDSFIIIDPSDDSEVQRGMLVVNVTPGPVRHIDDTLKTGHTRSTLAGATIEWRERTFVDEDGYTIHQREAMRTGMFEHFKDPKSGRDLILQVFVVGTDSALVGQLQGSAETIVAGGGRPDA